MKWLNWLLQPSLARRVVRALAVAFLLVFVVLLARDYQSYRSAVAKRQALKVGAVALEASLAFDDPLRVDMVMQAVEVQYRLLRRDAFERVGMECPGDLLFHVARMDGSPVYASSALSNWVPDKAALESSETVIRGQAYWGVIHETARWRITMLEPIMTDALLLPALGRLMLTPMLIAFPIILLPLWLAVRRGLAPLRLLSDSVNKRNPQDFSPLAMDIPYAELKPLVRTINELFARSRQSIARERAVVQDAAHELRTPLAVVATQAHHLLNAQGEDEKRSAKLALDQAIQRSSHMAHQLLTLATFEGRDEVALQRVDLVELTRQAVISLAPRASERRVDITLDSPDAYQTEVNTSAYLSILENLVVNAIHYGHVGGRISVSLISKSGQMELAVRDDGPGIAADDLQHLFERFYRGRAVVAPGAGLGLAIVKQAVLHMNGSITVGTGIDGRGVGFVVIFAAPIGAHRAGV